MPAVGPTTSVHAAGKDALAAKDAPAGKGALAAKVALAGEDARCAKRMRRTVQAAGKDALAGKDAPAGKGALAAKDARAGEVARCAKGMRSSVQAAGKDALGSDFGIVTFHMAAPITYAEKIGCMLRDSFLKALSLCAAAGKKQVYLDIYSGAKAPVGTALQALGEIPLSFDTLLNPCHDVTLPIFRAIIGENLRQGVIGGTSLGTPCASWSVARHGNEHGGLPPLRDRGAHIYGFPNLSANDHLRVELGNATMRASAFLISDHKSAGVPIMLENGIQSMLWAAPEIAQDIGTTSPHESLPPPPTNMERWRAGQRQNSGHGRQGLVTGEDRDWTADCDGTGPGQGTGRDRTLGTEDRDTTEDKDRTENRDGTEDKGEEKTETGPGVGTTTRQNRDWTADCDGTGPGQGTGRDRTLGAEDRDTTEDKDRTENRDRTEDKDEDKTKTEQGLGTTTRRNRVKT